MTIMYLIDLLTIEYRLDNYLEDAHTQHSDNTLLSISY